MAYINKDRLIELANYSESQPSPKLLTENFIPAQMDELKAAMQQDKELYRFLTTPAQNLPEHYKYLVGEITSDIEHKTLFDFIDISLTSASKFGIKTLFSKAGNNLKGYAAYIVHGNDVTEIKMFSFEPRQGYGGILIRDLDTLLAKLVQQYDTITWTAMRENDANRIYQKAIIKYKGSMKNEGDKIIYCINNKLI